MPAPSALAGRLVAPMEHTLLVHPRKDSPVHAPKDKSPEGTYVPCDVDVPSQCGLSAMTSPGSNAFQLFESREAIGGFWKSKPKCHEPTLRCTHEESLARALGASRCTRSIGGHQVRVIGCAICQKHGHSRSGSCFGRRRSQIVLVRPGSQPCQPPLVSQSCAVDGGECRADKCYAGGFMDKSTEHRAQCTEHD